MPLVGFEPRISAGKRPKIYALNRAATETGSSTGSFAEIVLNVWYSDRYSGGVLCD
jgi:hypothetical protein